MIRHARWQLVAAMVGVAFVTGTGISQSTAPATRKAASPASAPTTQKAETTPSALKIAAIGNSLTFHAWPERLVTEWAAERKHGQGAYERTICWGATLKAIFDKATPDVGKKYDSYLVPAQAWDALAIQVFQWNGDGASSLAEDVDYGSRFYALALAGNPNCQLYIYTTWKQKSHKAGEPVKQIAYYEKVADGIAAKFPKAKPVRIIPTVLVWERLAALIEAKKVPGLDSIDDIYMDDIHGGGKAGYYAVNYTWYATLYKESPVGLPITMKVPGDDHPPTPLPQETADVLQKLVWDVVTGYARSGVKAAAARK
jgi:hypothetical protein